MHVFAREIDALEKRWDSCEADLAKATRALENVVEFLTTDLEGHHTHAQRNGMTILIRETCKSTLRDLERGVGRRTRSDPLAQSESNDLSF